MAADLLPLELTALRLVAEHGHADALYDRPGLTEADAAAADAAIVALEAQGLVAVERDGAGEAESMAATGAGRAALAWAEVDRLARAARDARAGAEDEGRLPRDCDRAAAAAALGRGPSRDEEGRALAAFDDAFDAAAPGGEEAGQAAGWRAFVLALRPDLAGGGGEGGG